ncbi:MAG: hypothetical protein EA361_10085 [Bacteroidetes bacterium]|nr:MAG: hypothetical protein EA361_10085 [Bacteroidota bacterium]
MKPCIFSGKVIITLIAMVFLSHYSFGSNKGFAHLGHGDTITILLNDNDSFIATIERINNTSGESLILFLSIQEQPDCFLVLRSVHQNIIGTCQMGGEMKHVEFLYNKEKNQMVLKEESNPGAIMLSERKSLPSF